MPASGSTVFANVKPGSLTGCSVVDGGGVIGVPGVVGLSGSLGSVGISGVAEPVAVLAIVSPPAVASDRHRVGDDDVLARTQHAAPREGAVSHVDVAAGGRHVVVVRRVRQRAAQVVGDRRRVEHGVTRVRPVTV